MILFIVAIVLFMFGFVLLFGAPYVPTLKKQQLAALELLALKPGETLLELGCGDGRVLRAAAKQGIKGVGYELNPILYLVARVITWRFRADVRVIFGDYWAATWPKADGIYVFLLDKYMNKLHKKINQESRSKNVKLVSFAFKIPNKKTTKELNGLYLYEYRKNNHQNAG